MSQVYDLIIIGSGPAGLTADIYAERAKLNTLIIEKEYVSGGQIVNTYEVDNYTGLPGINGFDMGMKFKEHAVAQGANFMQTEVKGLRVEGDKRIVETEQGDLEATTVLIATGAKNRNLGVPGEEELKGKGVSYCATCDGAFFKGKTVAVVGGGDVAVEDAIFLGRLCEKVYIIHRRDAFRATKILQDALFDMPNIECVWDTKVTSINGEEKTSSITIESMKDGTSKELDVDGLFIAVGTLPNTEIIGDVVAKDKGNYIIAGEDGKTNVPGIFAAGDVRTKKLRQIITAASDGANAITSINEYFIELNAKNKK